MNGKPWKYNQVAAQAWEALQAGDEARAAEIRASLTPAERREMADQIFAELGRRLIADIDRELACVAAEAAAAAGEAEATDAEIDDRSSETYDGHDQQRDAAEVDDLG